MIPGQGNYWNSRFAIENTTHEFQSKPLPKVKRLRKLNGSEIKPTLVTQTYTPSRVNPQQQQRRRASLSREIQDGRESNFKEIGKLMSVEVNIPRKNKLLVPILTVEIESNGSYHADDNLEDSYSEYRQKRSERSTGNKTKSNPNSSSPTLSLFRLNQIGKGSSATVYKSILFSDLQIVAEKVIGGKTKAKSKQLLQEIDSLKQLFHNTKCPYIVSFKDCLHNYRDATMSLCLDYMDLGSLQDVIDSGGTKDEFVLQNILFQILSGLSYLHKNSIIHRDLKPGNVLLNSSGEVKISDFGVSKALDPEASQQSYVGTYSYMSPERMSGQPYSFAADIWSCGLTIEAVALGRYPYPISNDYWSILQAIQDSDSPIPSREIFSEHFCNLLRQALHKNPRLRPTADSLHRHPFMNKIDNNVFRLWIQAKKINKALSQSFQFSSNLFNVDNFVESCIKFIEHKMHSAGDGGYRILPFYTSKQIRNLAQVLNINENQLLLRLKSVQFDGRNIVQDSNTIGVDNDADANEGEEGVYPEEGHEIVEEILEGRHYSHLDRLPAEEVLVENYDVDPFEGEVLRETARSTNNERDEQLEEENDDGSRGGYEDDFD